MRPVLLTAVLLLAASCARKRDPAPTEMVDVVRFMFANWEDDEAMVEALDNLAPWLRDNAASEESEDGYRLDPLIKSDIVSVEHPDASLADLLGAAGGARSTYPIEDHANHMDDADQTWSNPSQYKEYVRSVDGNRQDFKNGEGLIRTVNEIETENWGVKIPYTLFKDYRWVDGEDSRGVVARSWIEKRACNDGGGNCLEQSFSIDLWLKDQSDTLRLTASWNELTSSIPLGEDVQIAGLALGLQNVFRATDDYLSEQ